MRIAVDHAETAERFPPRREEAGGEEVADRKRALLEFEQPSAFEPAHRQNPAGRQLVHHLRHPDRRLIWKHLGVKMNVLGFALVIELFAQSRGDLLDDLA